MKVKVYWNKRLNATTIMGKNFNSSTRKFAHNQLRMICEPYVPMQSGIMSQKAEATSKHLKYEGPYAMFQYVGLLMVGEESRRAWANLGERKIVVPGVYLNHSKEQHPLATREWDKAAMQNGGKEKLSREVAGYVSKQSKQNKNPKG